MHSVSKNSQTELLKIHLTPKTELNISSMLKLILTTSFHIQAELTKQQNDFKIKLKELEDSLLSRLSSAGGNFLGDTALVENLETTKRTAAEIEQKVWDCYQSKKI